jgi:hypothetical protein
MTLVVRSTLEPWQGEPLDGIRHPLSIEQLWSDAELLSVGVSRPEPFVLPDGKVAVGAPFYTLVVGEAMVREVYETQGTPPPSTEDVDRERDHRIDGGLEFGGKVFQTRSQDRENIAGASLAAFMAMLKGAQPGDTAWQGEGTTFGWIAADNTVMPMGPDDLIGLGIAVMRHKQAHIFAARWIKNLTPIPPNYQYDSVWTSAMAAVGPA